MHSIIILSVLVLTATSLKGLFRVIPTGTRLGEIHTIIKINTCHLHTCDKSGLEHPWFRLSVVPDNPSEVTPLQLSVSPWPSTTFALLFTVVLFLIAWHFLLPTHLGRIVIEELASATHL